MINESYNSEINRVVDALLHIKKTNCKSLPELLILLKNKSIEKKLRLKAFQVFGEVSAEVYLPEFLKILQDQSFDNDFRLAAAEILGKMKNKVVISNFREILFLENWNHKLRGTILRTLGEMKAEEIIDDLLLILQNHSEVFQKLENSYENQRFLKSMISQELRVIEKAFSDLQAKKSVAKLIRLLKDKSIVSLVRETIICSIGKIISNESILYLGHTLKDPNLSSPERKAAITAIGNLRISQAIPDLLSIVFDTSFSDQEHRAAIECLYKISDEECFEIFRKLLRNQLFDTHRRKLIAETLGKMQKVNAIDDLEFILNDPTESQDLQKTVITALGKMQSPKVMEILLTALVNDLIPEQAKLSISRTFRKSKDKELTFKLVPVLCKICKIKENLSINEVMSLDEKIAVVSKILENISNKSYIGWVQNIIELLSERIIQEDIKKLSEILENNNRFEIKVRYAKLLFENVKQRKLPICLTRNSTFSLKHYLTKLFDFGNKENN